MSILTASVYLNAAIFSCVGPIALLIGLVYWYVRTVGKLPWARNEIPKTNGNGTHSDAGGSSTGSA